jgi:hypothetical protein
VALIAKLLSLAPGWAFHDQRKRDPPDYLSGRALDIGGKVAPFLTGISSHMMSRRAFWLLPWPPQSPLVSHLKVRREVLTIMNVEEKARRGRCGV